MTTANEFELRRNERIIRSDMVRFSLSATAGVYPNAPTTRGLGNIQLARMVITSSRILWFPPKHLPTWYRIVNLWAVVAFRRFRLLSYVEEVDLVGVTRLWKWQPEFSGPPLIQAGEEGWTVRLLKGRHAWNTAPRDAQREHFADLRATWDAARSRAASHDDHP